MWELAVSTGMHRGELLALPWSDVDLENAVVRVERSVTQVELDRHYGTPKNHERRDVALDEHLVGSLRAWRKQQMAERLAWGASYNGSEDLLLVWEDGRPVRPEFITRTFGRQTDGLTIP